jgi:hypothetical protein
MSRKIKLISPAQDDVDIPIKPSFLWGLSPSAPTNLVVSSINSATSATLQWNHVPDSTSYNIYVDEINIGNTIVNYFDIANLAPNSYQNLGVSSVNVNGESSISFIPNIITSVTADINMLSSTEVILSWLPIPSATSYRVWADSLGYDSTFTADITQATIAIPAGSNNDFSLTALVDGELTPVTTITVNSPPDDITNFTASAITESGFTLQWFESSGAESYRLWDTLSSYEETFVIGIGNKVFTDVSPDTTFSFKLVAISDTPTGTVETSPASIIVTTSSWNPPALNPQLADVQGESITMTWFDIGADNYTVYLNGTPIAATTSTSYIFTGLNFDTAYTLGVRGHLATSYTSIETIDATTLAQIWVTNLTPTSFTVNWLPFNDGVSYTVLNNGVILSQTVFPPNLYWDVTSQPETNNYITIKAKDENSNWVGIDLLITVTTPAA